MNEFISRHFELISMEWHLFLDYWWVYLLIVFGISGLKVWHEIKK